MPLFNIRQNPLSRSAQNARLPRIGFLPLLYPVIASGLLLSPPAIAKDENDTPPWYIGATLGLSKINPDTDDTAFTVTDSSDLGVKLLGGLSLSKAFAIEFSANDMGSATLTSNTQLADVGYRTISIDGIFKFPNFLQSINPDLFVTAGLTALKNSTEIEIEKENQLQMKFGVGLDFPLSSSWVVRTSMEKFSGDTAFISAGILKYFGKYKDEAGLSDLEKNSSAPKNLPMTAAISDSESDFENHTIHQANSIDSSHTNSITTKIDTDQDGIEDSLDRCHDTLLGLTVDEKGCGIFDQSFSNIVFRVNSTVLTASARNVLDTLANELKKVPHIIVEVQAHTDNTGSSSYNIWLSNKRAEAIVSYLLLHSIPENRLHPRGYGETMPIATNKTRYGRAKNRRAEFTILHKLPQHPHP